MKIEALNIFPIKSARGQSVKEMKITAEGPQGDRQWMLIDDNGKFISQRTVPRLATVEVFYEEAALTVGFQKMFFKIATKNSFKRLVKVQIWNDSFDAALEPDLYSQGLSQYLGVSCRLVRYAPTSQRRVRSLEKDWRPEVRFADGRPLLLINQKSVDDLQSRMGVSVPVDRFRANLIVNTEVPYVEDSWKRLQIGDVVLSQPKKCTRCVMVNIDQNTGIPSGPEPLKTLASYRSEEAGVTFGTLWIPENEGSFKLGDDVRILES